MRSFDAFGRILTLTLALSIAAPLAHAQRRGKKSAKPVRLEAFDGSLADAEKQAAERNVPLLVLCVLEGEEASGRFQAQIVSSPDLADPATSVVVIVNQGNHELTGIQLRDAEGKRVRREVCSAFHTDTCEVHRRNWDDVYQRFVAGPLDGHWLLPEAIVVRPSGEIETRLGGEEPPPNSSIKDAIKQTRIKSGAGIDVDTWRRVQGMMQSGRDNSGARAFGDAWRAWSAVLTEIELGPLGGEAKAGLAAAEEGIESVLESILDRLSDETAPDVYRDLARRRRDYRETSFEKNITTSMKTIEKRPATKEAVARVKLEIEAEDLLDEAEELIASGEERQGKKLLERVVRRYGDTPAADRARSLLGD